MAVGKSLKESLHNNSRLGNHLLRNQLITRSQLAAALWAQRRSRRPLGEILVYQEAITRQQLRLSLGWQTLGRQLCITAALLLSPLQLTQAQEDHLSISSGTTAGGAYLKLSPKGDTRPTPST